MSQAQPAARPAGRGLRVLVAEDDESCRQQLSYALEELGHTCTTVADGWSAYELCQTELFDVVISDWHMPRMDGLALCRKLRVQQGREYRYFIFMTALGDKEHVVRGLREGADDYIVKPVDVEELDAHLTSARRIASIQQRLVKANAKSLRWAIAAHTDPLTGVRNRRGMLEDLAIARACALRYGHRYSVALCDVDHFKQYNDGLGHQAGDRALTQLAAAVGTGLRSGDRVYRYGGDELLALLPEQTLEEAGAAMSRVIADVEALRIPRDADGGVLTLSVGVAELGPEGSVGDWLRRADVALYRAKSEGRNRVMLDEPKRTP